MNLGLPQLAELFDALPIGLVMLDRQGHVVLYNRFEEKLARRKKERAIGRHFFREIAPCMDVKALGGAFRDKIGHGPFLERLEISFAFPFLEGPRDVVVYLRSLDIGGEPFAALIVEDVSAKRSVERVQSSLGELLRPEAGSPIAGILAGCGYLLHQEPDLAGQALQSVGTIAYEADQLQTLLMNLLDISRLERHGLDVVVERQALGPLISGTTELLRGHATRQGVDLMLHPSGHDTVAMVDPALLIRAMDSLLLNALRNAPHGSAVTVGIGVAEGGRPFVSVHDEGPPPADTSLLNGEHVYRSGPELSVPLRGTPLDLTIAYVQMACAAHGGVLRMHAAEGKGVTYWIDLPPPVSATDFLGV